MCSSDLQSIGLAVSTVSNPYFTEILQGVESQALASGYSLLIADPHDDPEHELTVVQLLHQRRVDGVIVAPSPTPDAMVGYLDKHAVPTVFLDRLVGEEYDQVCAENEAPTTQLVDHLAGLGHRRIGFVAGLPGLSTTTERLAGYRNGIADNGLSYDPALVAEGDSKPESAYRATRYLLDLPEPPTAIVTANNAMTIGSLRALRDAGITVPAGIAIAAFDDFSWADLFSPRLTAIAQPSREIGAAAVRLLLSRIEDPAQPPRTVRLDCTFVHRSSCGCPD